MKERALREKKTNFRAPKQLEKKNISVIGMGRFGSRLAKRLEEIAPPTAHIQPVADRSLNRTAASNSDLVVLTVRPNQMRETLGHMRWQLNVDAQVVSFAAHVALQEIEQMSGRPTARFMSDPWFQISAYVLGEGFSTQGLEYLFDGLTAVKPLKLNSNEEMEIFTHSIAHLFAVLFLRATGELENADAHLEYLAKKTGMSIDDFLGLQMEDSPQESVRIFATPGGVTEGIMKKLKENPSIRPEEV